VIGTWVALLMVLAGLLPGLGLAAFRWWRFRLLRPYAQAALQRSSFQGGCEHMSVSISGVSDFRLSCPHCGPLPVERTLQVQVPA
jgi:hypothetical protein